jgi:hypothetical protein
MADIQHDQHKQTVTVGGGIKAARIEQYLGELGPYAPVLGVCNDTGETERINL